MNPIGLFALGKVYQTRRAKMLEVYLLKRLQVIVSEGGEIAPSLQLLIKGELAKLGYRVEGPLYKSVLTNLQSTIATLKDIKGDNSKWVPLHKGFPDEVPDETEYFIKRLYGFLGDLLDIDLRESLFNPDDFSADPIYQTRAQDLFDKALEEQSQRVKDTHTVWKTLRAMPLEQAKGEYMKYIEGFLYANTSTPTWMQEEIIEFIKSFPIIPERISFKETIALVGKTLWEEKEYKRACQLTKQPTDLLRVFASLTGTDISLQKPIKFPKFPKAARRAILIHLNGMPYDILMANMWKYKDLWKAILKSLHVGEYPALTVINKVAAQLRNKDFKYRGWNSQVQAALSKGEVPEVLLVEQPGAFARMGRYCLNINPDCIKSLLDVTDKLPVKMLIQLAKYLKDDYLRKERAVVLKNGRIKVLESNPNALSQTTGNIIHDEFMDAARQQLAQRPSWSGERIYIDPSLEYLLAPFDARGVSEGAAMNSRGSRLPLDMTKTFRLFAYWCQSEEMYSVDVDLSATFYDKGWNGIDHCTFHSTSIKGAQHSGDIQSAPPPMGAFESIDIDLSMMRKRGVKYILPSLNLYRGTNIETCFCGWMEREKTSHAFATFDPKTVREKVNINREELKKGNWYSVLLDLEEEQIYICDVYLKGSVEHNLAVNMANNAALQLERIKGFHRERISMRELIELNMKARGGELVLDPDKADLVFDRCTLEDLM